MLDQTLLSLCARSGFAVHLCSYDTMHSWQWQMKTKTEVNDYTLAVLKKCITFYCDLIYYVFSSCKYSSKLLYLQKVTYQCFSTGKQSIFFQTQIFSLLCIQISLCCLCSVRTIHHSVYLSFHFLPQLP